MENRLYLLWLINIFYNVVSDIKSYLSFPCCQQYCLIICNNSNPEKTGGVNVAKIQFLKLSFREEKLPYTVKKDGMNKTIVQN